MVYVIPACRFELSCVDLRFDPQPCVRQMLVSEILCQTNAVHSSCHVCSLTKVTNAVHSSCHVSSLTRVTNLHREWGIRNKQLDNASLTDDVRIYSWR